MPKISPVHYRKLCRIFELTGWKYVRTKGDHMIYEKENYLRPVIIPKYKNIPQFVILNNLRTAKISRSEYLSLLKKV